MTQPGPMRTLFSMTAKGPMTTSSAISASGEMIAVGWIREAAFDIASTCGLAMPFQDDELVPGHSYLSRYRFCTPVGPLYANAGEFCQTTLNWSGSMILPRFA